jgi:hypothetical protein
VVSPNVAKNGFKHGLHRKTAGATGNSSKGLGWRGGGRRGAHDRGAPAWNRAHGKAGERGRSGWRESSPQHGASGALAQWRGWRHVARPKRSGNGGGFVRWEPAAASSAEPRARGRRFIRQQQAPWHAGPRFTRHGRRRVSARLELESKPGSGRRRPQQVGFTCQRENGEGKRKQAAWAD